MKIYLSALPCFIFIKTIAGQNLTDTIPRQDTLEIIQNDIKDNLPTLIIGDDDQDEGASTVISSILTAGRDPFLSAAEFNFSPVRFRLRGYESRGNAVYINGIDFNGLDNGFTPFSLWSGLNNPMRAQQDVYGMQASDFAIGSIALNTNVDMRASAQYAQTQIGYAFSNRNYRHRLSLSYGSGFNKNGWAYSFALTGRYANEGYVPGTYYRGMSYYFGMDKKTGNKNILSFIGFGAPTETGRQAASVQEAMNLAGTNFYNPSWGYQNGKKRNANVLETFQPVFMIADEYNPGNKSRLMTTVAYTFGKRKNSAIDWYNAPDPRPDYYRYLPSYYANDNPSLAETLENTYRANPERLQTDWVGLYEVNRLHPTTIQNVNGEEGNNVSGNRSLYILSNRVNNQQRLHANTVLNTKLSDVVTLTAGASYQQQVNHYYQEVKDLLGGDFWVNINQFAERDNPSDPNYAQNDLDHPNRIIKTGEQYGYNYKINMRQAAAWAQFLFRLKRVDLFMTGELNHTSFYRTGLNRNGLFPEASYGKSPAQNFLNPSAKAGVTYKINGRNYIFVNGGYMNYAPYFENAYTSPRTRNSVQDGLIKETILTTEAGYKLNAPRIKLGLTGYYTKFLSGFDVLSFFDDQHQSFVNYALSDIDKVFFGGELGIEYKITSTLSLNGAAAIGRYYYDSRQQAVVTVDNTAEVLSGQTVYVQNFRIPSTPQNAYSAGFFYRSPKFWYISFTGNYFESSWLSFNPMRRTKAVFGDTDSDDPASQQLIKTITQQEKFEPAFTLDFFGGWSKLLPRKYYVNNRRTYLVFNLGVNNLLNNKNIRSGGYEQLRFDTEGKDVNKFPPKYYYAYGLNYFASLAFRF